MYKIRQVDLTSQYLAIKSEIDNAIRRVIQHGKFINGPEVTKFAEHLAAYTGAKHVIPCGSGTDALLIALTALELKEDDEVIVPAFTYIAPAEMIALCRLKPVLTDVDEKTFSISTEQIEQVITARTKAIIPVHLFGQCCDMEAIMNMAKKYDLHVIEDNAQSLGAVYTFHDGKKKMGGTIGHINCTSFFPAKNLGCFGDGGAIFTNNDDWAKTLRMIANHGQKEKYVHDIIGCNSRLDTLQAAILDVKLKYLDIYAAERRTVANRYSAAFELLGELVTPVESMFSTHVYNQYTLRVKENRRDALKQYLAERGIPSAVYYPLPMQKQPALKGRIRTAGSLEVSARLCNEVLSLPVHTEMSVDMQNYIIEEVLNFFHKN
ncbi:MAG: DegT/DnrJ/EryC1/StrS family aminotransferase [Bacteroidales bacterium]|jgi:dTDP-4-amino-4,6-dideoxygalactose transaminase|nr:DegT/DnrJ/EryC1/StrS family aminotransferase [Bacteroidales bacterium]